MLKIFVLTICIMFQNGSTFLGHITLKVIMLLPQIENCCFILQQSLSSGLNYIKR